MLFVHVAALMASFDSLHVLILYAGASWYGQDYLHIVLSNTATRDKQQGGCAGA